MPAPTARTDSAFRTLAAGRIALGVAALAAPRRFGLALGVSATPPSVYLARVYGARAIAMGAAGLTGAHSDRAAWRRRGLAIDVADTLSGLPHLLRRDVPSKAAWSMLALTAGYAVVGAAGLLAASEARS